MSLKFWLQSLWEITHCMSEIEVGKWSRGQNKILNFLTLEALRLTNNAIDAKALFGCFEKKGHSDTFFFRFQILVETFIFWDIIFKGFSWELQNIRFVWELPHINKTYAVILCSMGGLLSPSWQVSMFVLALVLYWFWTCAHSYTSHSLSSLGEWISLMIHTVEFSAGPAAMECRMMKSLEPWNVLSQPYGPWTRKCVGAHDELTGMMAQLLHIRFQFWHFKCYVPLRLTLVPEADLH